jgi:hypothetical protein
MSDSERKNYQVMNYNGRPEPCAECPFLNTPKMRSAFTLARLRQFADNGEFPCHKTASESEEGFVANEKSVACAGMLIFNEKRERPNQMMRVSERLGFYDRSKLNMKANVR